MTIEQFMFALGIACGALIIGAFYLGRYVGREQTVREARRFLDARSSIGSAK
jgi:uncharacterized membrane protein YciS (DUF1049 family)